MLKYRLYLYGWKLSWNRSTFDCGLDRHQSTSVFSYLDFGDFARNGYDSIVDQRLGLAIFFGGSDFCDTSYRHHAHLLGVPSQNEIAQEKLAASHVAFVLSGTSAAPFVGECSSIQEDLALLEDFRYS